MAEYSAAGFGDRLRKAMERQGWTVKSHVRRLQQDVHKATRGARGTSYGSIYSYVHGQGPPSEPRREVVDALAKVLKVLPDHLLFGGPKTIEESALGVPRDENRIAAQRLRIAVYEAVKKEAGALLPVGVDVGIIELIMTTVARMAADTPGVEPDHSRFLEAASCLGRGIVGPLRALGLDPARWPEPVKAQYVLQVLATLLVPLDLKYAHAVGEWSANRTSSRPAKVRTIRRGK